MKGRPCRTATASASPWAKPPGSNATLLSSMLKFQDSGAHDIIFSSGSNDWFVPGKNGQVVKV